MDHTPEPPLSGKTQAARKGRVCLYCVVKRTRKRPLHTRGCLGRGGNPPGSLADTRNALFDPFLEKNRPNGETVHYFHSKWKKAGETGKLFGFFWENPKTRKNILPHALSP